MIVLKRAKKKKNNKKKQNPKTTVKSRIIKIFFKVFRRTECLFPVSLSLKGRGNDVM